MKSGVIMKPLVSVIIPVYNVEQYLEECLDSVVNQGYSNIEIITINDGSTDDSLKILESYQEQYDKIKVVNKENSGQSDSRNKGIDLATGRYLIFLDSDDYLLTNTIENLVPELENNNLDLIRYSAEPFADQVNYPIYKKQYDFDKYFTPKKVYNKEDFLSVNLKAYSTSPCLFIVKKDVLTKNEIKFKSGIQHEDELFTLEVFLNVDSASYDPTAYYKRRYRENSVMTTNKNKNLKKSFDAYCVVLKEMDEFSLRYNKKNERRLIKKRMRLLYGIVSNAPVENKNNKLKEIQGLNVIEKKYSFSFYYIKQIIKKIYFKMQN